MRIRIGRVNPNYASEHLHTAHTGGMRIRMDIPRLVEAILRLPGWTQARLAKAAGVGQPAVSRWRKGSKPEVENRDRLLELGAELGIIPVANPKGVRSIPIVGHVGAGGEVLFAEGQGPFGEAQMPHGDVSDRLVAVVVRGDSMSPQLEDGWLVYYEDRHEPPTLDLINKLCVCGLTDGRVLVKKLMTNRAGGFILYSHNAAPIADEMIEWAAPVTWIAPG